MIECMFYWNKLDPSPPSSLRKVSSTLTTLCTGVDTSNNAWKQAQLSLSRGGIGYEASQITQQFDH